MRYTRNLISLVLLALLVGLGSLVLGTDQVNAQNNCQVTIEKAAFPADDTPFTFSVTGAQNFEFTLSDPSDNTNVIEVDNGSDEAVTLTEAAPPGWSLTDISCTIGQDEVCGGPCLIVTELANGQGVLMTCIDDSFNSCTFTNFGPRPIPTLSHWGLIALAGIFILVGIWGISRKKAEA